MKSSNGIQIVFAILFVLILTFVAYFVYNREMFNSFSSNNIQKEVSIFTGILDFSSSQFNFETYNKNASSFKDLTPSVNQQGGAEYSYNFWLYKNSEDLNSYEDIVLLLRGSDTEIPYISDKQCSLQKNINKKYYLVKNPLIRLADKSDSLIVEYNTLTSPDAYRESGKSAIDCQTLKSFDKNKGLLGIYDLDRQDYNKKWFMVSVVLQETNPNGDILTKNKTVCKIYLNGSLVLDRVVESPHGTSYGSSTMKHNRGKLYVNLQKIDQEDILKMADLSYFNYSLDGKKIAQLFNKKFTQAEASANTDGEDQKEYNISRVNEDNLPKPF